MEQTLTKKPLPYDKAGEEHYNLISAFHKSLRGSDAQGSLYWLYRMLTAGVTAFRLQENDPVCIRRCGSGRPSSLVHRAFGL